VMLTPQYFESGARPAGLLPPDHSLITAGINRSHEPSTRNHHPKVRNATPRRERHRGRERVLTYEGPDEAYHVLREVEEREVVEPPRLRPESLRRSEPGNPGKVSYIFYLLGAPIGEREREREAWDVVLTAFPGGRPG
jgi:hypothetical protein